MLHIVESRKPLDRVAKDLEEAVARCGSGSWGGRCPSMGD
jgi:hypothetical protein